MENEAPDNPNCSTVEVLGTAEDNRLPFSHPLLLVCPLSCQLDSCLDGLSTGVHWKNHVITKESGDPLGKLAEYRIVEGSRGQSQSLRLFHQCLDNARMAMSLQSIISKGVSSPR